MLQLARVSQCAGILMRMVFMAPLVVSLNLVKYLIEVLDRIFPSYIPTPTTVAVCLK